MEEPPAQPTDSPSQTHGCNRTRKRKTIGEYGPSRQRYCLDLQEEEEGEEEEAEEKEKQEREGAQRALQMFMFDLIMYT